MSYTQLPPTLSYPDVATTAWAVISRLSESPIRTVPSLTLVNHASEIGIPFPTGRFPAKAIIQTEEYQDSDSLGRPLYDNGLGGTISPVDGSGHPLPPLLASVSEQVVVSLRDRPDKFTTIEVIHAAEKDFLVHYNQFYNWAKLITFDDRFDTISTYQDQQVASGFGSGGHPIFLGPVQGFFSQSDNPGGHILLVAPTLQGIDWVFQIRHGSAGPGGFHGPLRDISLASRQVNSGNTQEVTKLYPMENTPIPHIGLVDATGQAVSHFWIRTYPSSQEVLPDPASIIPFIIILGRSSGKVT